MRQQQFNEETMFGKGSLTSIYHVHEDPIHFEISCPGNILSRAWVDIEPLCSYRR